MSKQIAKPALPPSIYIRRVDGVTFELCELREGNVTSLAKDVFSLVNSKAQLILQQMAEGSYK